MNTMILKRYAKFIVAIGGALVVLGAAVTDGKVSVEEGWAVAAAVLTAFGVRQIPNAPPGDVESAR